MLNIFKTLIEPEQRKLEQILGVKRVTVRHEEKISYPSVWKVTHHTPDAGFWHIQVNKLQNKYDPVHKQTPF